jgi:hypothetical protein
MKGLTQRWALLRHEGDATEQTLQRSTCKRGHSSTRQRLSDRPRQHGYWTIPNTWVGKSDPAIYGDGRVLTSKSKNWLSSPYFAFTGVAALQRPPHVVSGQHRQIRDSATSDPVGLACTSWANRLRRHTDTRTGTKSPPQDAE